MSNLKSLKSWVVVLRPEVIPPAVLLLLGVEILLTSLTFCAQSTQFTYVVGQISSRANVGRTYVGRTNVGRKKVAPLLLNKIHLTSNFDIGIISFLFSTMVYLL